EPAVPDARPAAVLHQPPGAAAPREGAPGQRPRGADRHDRHRPRRGGPVKVLTPTVLTYVKVVVLVALVPAIVGVVIVLAERRIMGFMQARLGTNRVGPKGLLQGVADLLKLVTKEDIPPARAEKAVHFLAPV